MRAIAMVACLGVLFGCGSGGGGSGGDGGGSGGGDLGGGGGPGSDGGGACLGSELLAALGRTHLLIGASMEDATAAAAPFDLRYLYISGLFPDQGDPCASCATNCSTTSIENGQPVVHSCANAAGGCGWWGCWQYDQDPPGAYVPAFIAAAEKNGQLPLFTWYVLLQASGVSEVPATEVAVANDATFMRRYYDHFRFFLQKIGTSTALVHIEPDFWGYVERVSSDPTKIPAQVSSVNSDCAGLDANAAGMARCLIKMVRTWAPNAKVALHGSAWGTGMDALLNTQASFDAAAEAATLGRFLVALGAADADFLAVDASDRDAGYYQVVAADNGAHFWDATNQKLPDFHQAFTWAKSLAETVNKPLLWWQIPVGNTAQPNTCQHYQDNRVDYLFAHPDEVTAAHAIGLAFGAGDPCQTTPETDGNNLLTKARAYAQRPQPLCN